jgi:stage IV sporulation protein FA
MREIDVVQNRIKSKKNNTKKENKNNFEKKIIKFLLKLTIITIIFCILSILVRNNITVKNNIYKYVYNTNMSFSSIKKFYNSHIGNIIPFQNIFEDKKVFNEKLEYKELSTYNKGVKLKLSDNYSIPIIKEGIVIFVGEKDNIGKTVIIQQSDGIDAWYGNLSNINVKLYDYVEDNMLIGEASNNELYLEFQKDGVNIDYKEVLK